jgi:dolichyl-phosphate beta-glucosyltransferase
MEQGGAGTVKPVVRPFISVVIPAFNEEGALPGLLDGLLPVLESVARGSWEVVISDDGSTDGTARVPDGSGSDPRVRVVRSDVNRGKGAALRSGVKECAGEFVLFCDADMPVPPATVVPFLDALKNGAHIAIGNRKSPETIISRGQPVWRGVLGSAYGRLSAIVTATQVEDFNCGFKLFRGDIARELMARTLVQGWAIDIELLALAARRGYVTAELPVIWRHGEKSSVRPLQAILETLWEMAQIRMRLRKKETARS